MENISCLETLKNYGLEIENILPDSIFNELDQNHTFEKTVIGLDIYHYSKMENKTQILIPVIFDLLFVQAENWMKQYEKNLIKDQEHLQDSFIHTGDGGFLLVDNPIIGIVFLLHFYTLLNLYNSGLYLNDYYAITKEIEIRACMTKGSVFKYHSNYFGKAIIQNARILAADKLNRFLIDENVNNWFNENINGITSLLIRTGKEIEDILKLPNESLKDSYIFCYNNFLTVAGMPTGNSSIKHVTKQKIGEISVKEDKNSIYNVEIQRYAHFEIPGETIRLNNIVITIGNSNASGLII
ncbi:MAG: hypothetical protein VZQ47_10420 [Treponema sp.]|nr:hypothetical protein [Treponema sp.]